MRLFTAKLVKTYLLLWSLQLSVWTFAQETKLTGRITTAQGQAIVGANVRLLLQKTGTTTDSLGRFSITSNRQAGERLKITCIGYEQIEMVLPKNGQLPLQVTLQPLTQNLGEVVVTGQLQPQSVRNSVFQVRVIDRQRIEQRAATNVVGVLNNELGFRFSNDMALGTTDVQLLGMSGRNVKILLDGVPMLDRGDTRESLNQIDIHTIERIEIVEGPMSVSYGTDALAGVINIITKKANRQRWSIYAKIQEESVGKEYSLQAHPDFWQGVHVQSIGGTWQNKRWDVSAGLSQNAFGGWQGNATGRSKEWLPKNQILGHFKAGMHKDYGNWYYRNDFLQETIHSLGNVNTNTLQARDQKYITHRMMHQLQANLRLGSRTSFLLAAAYTDYQRKTQTTILDFTTNKRTLSLGQGEQDVARFDNAMVRSTLNFKQSATVQWQTGIEMNFDHASGGRIAGSPRINDYALFVSSVIAFDSAVQIRPGFRLIHNTVYQAPPVIPAINAKIRLSNQLDWRVAYARGFRSPALRELYFNFFDASHAIKGNPNLKAEESDSFNASLTFHQKRSHWVLTGFYNDFRNLISYGADPNDPSVSQTINIDRFKTTGSTLSYTFNSQKIKSSFGFSYIGRYNQLLSDEAYSSQSMRTFLWSPEWNANVSYTFPQSRTTLGFFYKFTGQQPAYLGEQNSDGSVTVTLSEVKSYQWADFTLTQLLGKHLQVQTGVKNIANLTRLYNTANTGSAHSSSTMPMSYGRSYFVGISYQLAQN